MAKNETSEKTLTVNGNVYTIATDLQQSEIGGKIFSAGDGMKQGDKVFFATDAKVMHTSAVIDGVNRAWLAIPCMVERNGQKFESVISIATLTGSAYSVPNPESGTQKNVPFNPFISEAIAGKNDGKEKITAVLSVLKGKSFSINRVDFHTPKEFVNVIVNGEIQKKANGANKMTPKLTAVGEKMQILTNVKTVSRLG